MIRKEGNEIDFIHNLFQENYCAKYLSTLAFEEIKKCITYAPEFEKIKPKWANTIAAIFNITDESSPLFSNLLNFILESEPSLLVRFEYDKIDLVIRLSVFRTIMQDNNRYYQTFNFSELILFAGIKENPDVIKYILANITSYDQKLTRDLIYLLKYANPRDLFGLGRDIVEKCQNILSSNEFGDDIHEEALECLDTLNLVDEEFISWLFDYRPSFNKKNVISIVFKLLTNLKLVDTYIDFFIDSIPICNEKLIRNNYTVSTGAKYNFYKGIATSKSINSIKKILNRILNIPEIESDSHDKILCINHLENDFANPLVSLMILAYNEDSSCLPEILNVVSKISSRFYGMTTFEKYKPFFETTKSTTEAFLYYWDNKHKRNFDWSIGASPKFRGNSPLK